MQNKQPLHLVTRENKVSLPQLLPNLKNEDVMSQPRPTE